MKKSIFKIGIVLSAIATIAPSANAQSVIADRTLLSQNNSQGCIYENRELDRRSKVCRKPQINGIRIDACLFSYASNCTIKTAADKFCSSQTDGYTKHTDHGVSDRETQTVSIISGEIYNRKNPVLVPFSYIRCYQPNSVANNKPKKERSDANQPNRDTKRNQSARKNNAPLFKGALDLANTRQFTISVPIGNGQRQDVPIRISEDGQLIDPLTNKVAIPIRPSQSKNTLGARIVDNALAKVRINIERFKNSNDLERLQFSIEGIDYYGNIPDVIEIIESRLTKVSGINISSMAAQSIASGFITGDFPDSLGLKDLDGLGILPIFNKVNAAFKKVNNEILKK